MIKLSSRLKSIAALVDRDSNLIDIGCDHGLLDIYLYQNNITNSIIASDVNENALDSAKKNLVKYNCTNGIETRLGNGLDVITSKDKIDTIVISGMGAHTIVGILKNNIDKLKNINNIIVGSNNQHEFLRREIVKLNYIIKDEVIIKDDNKIYIIIKFVRGRKRYTKKELYFGPILLKNNSDLFIEYKNKSLEKLNILKKIIPQNKYIDRYKLLKEIKLYK